MKILQVSSSSYAVDTGLSEYVRNISARLAKTHDVTVFATNPESRLPRSQVIDEVNVERFPANSPYYFSWAMMLRLRKERFDVVHGHNYHAFPLHMSALAKCSRFVISPVFHGAGHTTFRSSLILLSKSIGKRTLAKAEKLLAASDYEKNILQEYFNFDPSRIDVIPRGVNFEEFEGLKHHQSDQKSVLYVGRLVDYKGVQHLLEVLPKLKHKDVILKLVGKGSMRDSLEKRARQLNVHQNIRFYHDLERRELLQMYSDADVFVLPSRYEAYSKVVAEALVAGTPCIVTDTSALSEWIDNQSVMGVKFPVDISDLTELIDFVLDRPRNKIDLSRWRHKILDWNEVVARLEQIYAR